MKDKLATMLATFFYVGKFPLAPGSAASAVAVGLAFLLRQNMGAYLLVIALVSLIGVWASARAEKVYGKKDPGCVVIDEVAGVLISFFMVPMNWPIMITGYFLFRAFDMFKVQPAAYFESKGGGAGIMLDDIVAGVYTNLVLQIAVRLAIMG